MIQTQGLFEVSNEIYAPSHSPISLDYFLNMELAKGSGGKEIINKNGELKTVLDVVKYFSNSDNLTKTLLQLQPSNWQYFNCMIAEFRDGVESHHKIGWKNMTKDYYDNLRPMTDEEIEISLKDNPVDFHNGFIKHGYHRACAMIGRLLANKSYIPFYMETNQIYKESTKHDNIHRIKPLTNKIHLLKKLDEMNINKNEYCLAQSSILSLMGIRDSDDLDIIISSNLRNQNIKFPEGIDVFPPNISKFNYFGAKGDDDLINNYSIKIDGYKFLEPRFYFARKNQNKKQRDIDDWNAIEDFFIKNKHEGYPFNFDWYKWGINYVRKVSIEGLKNINGFDFETIINKFDRVVDGVNHGRSVFYDETNKQYIKLFNPEYCRLSNFIEALNSGFLNGLCPALTNLIYNGDTIVGYVCQEGTVCKEVPQDFLITILRNCKKYNKIYYDIVPQNIVKLPNGQYSLIDLESVYNLDDLDKLPKHNAEIKPGNLLELINAI